MMSPVAPWQHVRTLGEDLVATEMVLPENHRLRPVDLGACAAAGVTEIPVRRQPRIAIIPTGNELVPPGAAPLKPGDIVEFNTLMLAGMVREWGGHAQRFSPVRDDFALIRNTVKDAMADYDLVIVNAGSSAGSEDYTAAVVEELGRSAGAWRGRASGASRRSGTGGRQAGNRPARLSRVRRLDRRVVRKTPARPLAGNAVPSTPESRREHHPQGIVAVGRGRVPAGQAGPGRRENGRDAAATGRGGHNVLGQGRRAAAHSKIFGGTGRRGRGGSSSCCGRWRRWRTPSSPSAATTLPST